jgi:uncharacterized damage-inducible protein DinB
MNNAPDFPAGAYTLEPNLTTNRRQELIDEIAGLPDKVSTILKSFKPGQIDRKYRNWTARQIVHHLADSHANAYIRFRLALTENEPTIKPYNESLWVELHDAKNNDVEDSCLLLTAIHRRWVSLLKSLSTDDLNRTYYHPEYQKLFRLDDLLSLYAHHGRHHAGQLLWMVENS